MRQKHTLILIVNALVDPRIVMARRVDDGSSTLWSCFDFSNERTLEEKVFCLTFENPDDAARFEAAFGRSQQKMAAQGMVVGERPGAEQAPAGTHGPAALVRPAHIDEGLLGPFMHGAGKIRIAPARTAWLISQ